MVKGNRSGRKEKKKNDEAKTNTKRRARAPRDGSVLKGD